MLIAVAPLVVLVAGVLAYGLAANPKAAEIGRIAYFVGLLWLVYVLIGHTVRL